MINCNTSFHLASVYSLTIKLYLHTLYIWHHDIFFVQTFVSLAIYTTLLYNAFLFLHFRFLDHIRWRFVSKMITFGELLNAPMKTWGYGTLNKGMSLVSLRQSAHTMRTFVALWTEFATNNLARQDNMNCFRVKESFQIRVRWSLIHARFPWCNARFNLHELYPGSIAPNIDGV